VAHGDSDVSCNGSVMKQWWCDEAMTESDHCLGASDDNEDEDGGGRDSDSDDGLFSSPSGL
jgi:hypothetical protein